MMGWRGPLPDIVSLPQVSKTIRLTALSCPSTLHSNTIESFQRSTAAGGLPRDNREKPMSILTRGISAALLAAGMAFPALTAQAQDLVVGVSWSNFQEERWRSEEHTSELQSLMRISYAVFCLKNISHIYR